MKKTLSLATMLAWQDIRQAYRRSAIGPFWITASMAVQIAAMGVVFGIIFKTSLYEYLPFLASGIILWALISGSVIEGCMTFINSESMMKQLDLNVFVYVLRVVLRNLLNLAHNIVVIPLVFLIIWHPISWQVLLFVPGMLIVLANLSWMTVVLGMLSARYRDIPQTVQAIMTIVYFITPVMWQPQAVGAENAHLLLGLNPFYHMLQLIRQPFLSASPTFENWALGSVFAVAGWLLALGALRKFGKQIAYWV
jgi:ABC-type polysaccharide/polyol phosphate export permease